MRCHKKRSIGVTQKSQHKKMRNDEKNIKKMAEHQKMAKIKDAKKYGKR